VPTIRGKGRITNHMKALEGCHLTKLEDPQSDKKTFRIGVHFRPARVDYRCKSLMPYLLIEGLSSEEDSASQLP